MGCGAGQCEAARHPAISADRQRFAVPACRSGHQFSPPVRNSVKNLALAGGQAKKSVRNIRGIAACMDSKPAR